MLMDNLLVFLNFNFWRDLTITQSAFAIASLMFIFAIGIIVIDITEDLLDVSF